MWNLKARPTGPVLAAWLGGLLMVLATAACGAQTTTEIIGSGVLASEQRPIGTFTSLSVTASSADVYVSIGGPAAIKISSDDNIVPLITTSVSNSELAVGLTRAVSTRLGMRIDITTPVLNSVKVGATAKLHVSGIEGEQFILRGELGSQITATGKATNISLTLVGGSRADLRSLEARDGVVSLDGASTAEVLATNSLSGEAHAVSHLGVWGPSPMVNVQTSEGSTVTMMGMPAMS